MGTGNRPSSLTVSLVDQFRFRAGDRGSGEVGVLLVAGSAAAQHRDAEEVQHRGTGVDQQAHGGGGRRDQDGEQVQDADEAATADEGSVGGTMSP